MGLDNEACYCVSTIQLDHSDKQHGRLAADASSEESDQSCLGFGQTEPPAKVWFWPPGTSYDIALAPFIVGFADKEVVPPNNL